MLPDHVLSTIPILGYYLSPDDKDYSFLKDYELGGVALNDPTQGLMVRTWYVRLVIDGVKELTSVLIGSEGLPVVTDFLFLSGAPAEGITEVSLTFDQNMNPVVAYMQSGQAKFFWFDTTIPGYTTTVLPGGSRSPKCCLDDKRRTQLGTSDILLFYMRNDVLYFREQRDRYTIEYTLKTGVVGDVLIAGMSSVNRVQIAVGLQDYPAGTINRRKTTEAAPNKRVTVDGRQRRLVRLSYG